MYNYSNIDSKILMKKWVCIHFYCSFCCIFISYRCIHCTSGIHYAMLKKHIVICSCYLLYHLYVFNFQMHCALFYLALECFVIKVVKEALLTVLRVIWNSNQYEI